VSDATKDMKLIVGLGNPGKEYASTRHNAGFLVLDEYAKKQDLVFKADTKRKAELVKTTMDDADVILAKPTTFMNLSGDAVQALISFYKVKLEDVLIVQDEMDLEPGTLAFKAKGGDAGNNGIASIQERLGTKEIARLRIGVGRPTGRIPTEDWVLGKMNPDTKKICKTAGGALEDWATNGLANAMNTWNRKES
jgi:PTH1 family peptidyl-tRNA hydrolase